MQNNQANPDKLVQHMKATYGDQWPERILLSSFHLSYYILNSQRIYVSDAQEGIISDQLPVEVLEGIDTLYTLVYALYDQD
ncbi:hypothetical protein [Ekhidna sp.]|jgi:hypothetical protein|uniref:hypothetical protein n=1 Tax=Ekhidna sp. TaxID=2608089 RepID=UPI0032EB4234